MSRSLARDSSRTEPRTVARRPDGVLDVPPPARVVILRALKLGDLLCLVPALRALRAALPRSEIILIGLPWARDFVARYPEYLDGFREFPGYPGLPERPPDIRRLPAFLAGIQRERFDLALQMHGSGSFVNSLTVLFGAAASAGFYEPGGFCPDETRYLPWPQRGLEIHRLLALVEHLGLAACGDHLEFPITAADESALTRLAAPAGLEPGYVCIHPGASVAERRWPLEHFAAVAQRLARQRRVVLTGSAAEAPLTAELARLLAGRALDLAGRTDLGTLAAVLSRAGLLVCNDTGVSHLAAALGTPSVVLSTGDNPARWAPLDAARHRVLPMDAGVTPHHVLRHAKALLDNHLAPPAEHPPGPSHRRRPCTPSAC